MPNLLDDLAFKYGADKTPRIKHHYTDVYFDLFKDRRETVKKVLEIGVAEGASLFMWRDFFPNAQIYGAEIDQERVDALQGEDRVKVYQADQSEEIGLYDMVCSVAGDLDIIIDDGSHNPEHQLLTCKIMMSQVKKNGVYIIEDVDNEKADYIFEQLFERYDVQMIRVGTRHDDRLIIVRHKQ